jgi:hypothetical protein
MKGMMFTEFLEMVEARYGLAVMDRVIVAAKLANGGAYTAVGSYDHAELLRLAERLAIETGTPLRELLIVFADTVFELFKRRYGPLIGQATGCFDFLGRIETYIHVEVRKLYPDAELPAFSYPSHDAQRLIMEYRSPRPMAIFAEGLVMAAIRHYGEPIRLNVEDLADGRGTAARFTMTREPAA